MNTPMLFPPFSHVVHKYFALFEAFIKINILILSPSTLRSRLSPCVWGMEGGRGGVRVNLSTPFLPYNLAKMFTSINHKRNTLVQPDVSSLTLCSYFIYVFYFCNLSLHFNYAF